MAGEKNDTFRKWVHMAEQRKRETKSEMEGGLHELGIFLVDHMGL